MHREGAAEEPVPGDRPAVDGVPVRINVVGRSSPPIRGVIRFCRDELFRVVIIQLRASSVRASEALRAQAYPNFETRGLYPVEELVGNYQSVTRSHVIHLRRQLVHHGRIAYVARHMRKLLTFDVPKYYSLGVTVSKVIANLISLFSHYL